jgi:TolA-binding protein
VTQRQTSPASPKPGRFCLWAALLTAAAGAGCMTSFEGRRLHADLNDIGARLDGVDQRDKMYKQQVAQLDEVLEKASALLSANSNDVASKTAKAEADIAALQVLADRLAQSVAEQSRQRTDELSRLDGRMAMVARSQTEIVDRVAPTLPADKEQLWKQAGDRLASGQRDQGRRFYRSFIERFPQDPRAAKARLALGISFAQEGRFSTAAAEFQQLLDTFPSSPEVPEAMQQLSLAFVHLHFCSDARALLRDLVKRYPRSAPAAEAHKELKAVGHLPGEACTS